MPLLDQAAVLAAMAYVDLNPIRAAMAETPEASDYTSAQDRCRARQAHRATQLVPSLTTGPTTDESGLWIASILRATVIVSASHNGKVRPPDGYCCPKT